MEGFNCRSLVGVIPDAPPKISSVDSPQLESMARSVVSEAEQRIADLEEIKRRSSETHQLILRRLEEYHSYALYHKSFFAPIFHFPSELLSEIFVICVTDESGTSCLSNLGKVCRRWRDIVHTTPRLWNCPPGISASPGLETAPSRLQIHFTLARDLPVSIDVFIHEWCVTVTPMLKTLVTHSDRIGELKIQCDWKGLCLLSGMSSRLRNLRTLELRINKGIENTDIAIFSIAPQLRDFCLLPSRSRYQFSRLGLLWAQLKTVTIRWPDLDYAWMVLSKAPHMEMCTFIHVENAGNPCGIIRHTGLKGLSFKKLSCNSQAIFPASLFNNLVLPNLSSLFVQLDELTIDPIIALIARSGCKLTRLALNSYFIEDSLRALLVETPSLTHLELDHLWPTSIKDLTIDKDSKNDPIAPHLRVIQVRKFEYVDVSAWCLLLNTLIQSRVDSLQSIQEIHLNCDDRSYTFQIYRHLRGIPWTPSSDFGYGYTVDWARSLCKLICKLTGSSLPPKDDVISSLNATLDQMLDDHRFIEWQPYLATSEIYDNVVDICSLTGNHLELSQGWGAVQSRIRRLLKSWTELREKYGEFPQSIWKKQQYPRESAVFYLAPHLS